MLEEKRLRLMIRLARYEQQDGKDDLKISKYYRRDYVAFALLKNFFLITVAYALVLGMIIMYHLDFLLDHMSELNMNPLVAAVALGYLFLLGIYSVIVFTMASLRYARAQKSVKTYYGKLEMLNRMYKPKKKAEQGTVGRKI